MTRPLIFKVLETLAGDRSLTASDRLVLIYLAKYGNGDGTGCTASNATLARDLCITRRQVERSIARLRERGFVTRRRRRWVSALTSVTIPQEPTSVSVLEDQEPTSASVMGDQEPTPRSLRTDTTVAQNRHHGRTTSLTTSLTTESSSSEPVPFTKILETWNEAVPHVKIRAIAGKRREAVRARCREYGVDGVLELIAKVAASPFITGKVEGTHCYGRGMSVDWCFSETNAPKILEGRYDGEFRRPAPAAGHTSAGASTGNGTPWDPQDVREHDGTPEWDAYFAAMEAAHGTHNVRWPRFGEWMKGNAPT